MAKKANDKTTGSSGKEAVEEGKEKVTPADGEPEEGAEGEGQDENEDEGTENPTEDEDEGDEPEGDGDGKSGKKPANEKTYTKKEVDAIVKKRVDRLTKKHSTELTTINSRLEGLETERTEERKTVKASLQAEVDALPDEVKAMAPKLDAKDGIKNVRTWLASAKKLAEKLSKAAKVPGLDVDPTPDQVSGDKLTAEQVTEQARKHSIYQF